MDLEESRKKEKDAAKDEVHEAAGGLSFSRVADLNRSSILSTSLPKAVMQSRPFVHPPAEEGQTPLHTRAAELKALRHEVVSTNVLGAAYIRKSLH